MMMWSEHDGPPVTAPTLRGFGIRLIERGLSQDLGGMAELDFAATGVICTIKTPLAKGRPERSGNAIPARRHHGRN